MLQVDNNTNKLSNLQLELLKSLKYIATENQLQDVRSLLGFYFEQQLDAAIEDAELERGYSQATYESWLTANAETRKNI